MVTMVTVFRGRQLRYEGDRDKIFVMLEILFSFLEVDSD